MINILTHEIRRYAGERDITFNAYEDVFAVISTQWGATRQVNVDLLVRLIDNQIVIEQDTSPYPLGEALVKAGIPRSQIVLAYLGEMQEEELCAD